LTFFDSFFVSPPAKPVGQEDKKGIEVTGAKPLIDLFRYKSGYS
jgi:hypothetical protein